MKESTNNIPILTYHSIDESGSVISTSPGMFRRQMTFLKENGFRTITLSEFVAIVESGLFPPRHVVLTFDDGFQNFLTTAFPVLQDLALTATVFLVTDYCGRINNWAGNGQDIPREQLLSWSEVKGLAKYGIEFGAHTRTHADLTRLPATRIDEEMIGSQRSIQDALGSDVKCFAYPFGKFNRYVKERAANTFRAVCTTKLGKAGPSCDLSSLDRIDAYYLGREKAIQSISSRNFDRYLAFRQVLRSLRSRITTISN
jgi:peptidoglycan/xylan/chitin deacetylase (PgdA/CDA1 family)